VRLTLLLIVPLLFVACGDAPTGNEAVSDDGAYRFEYELHDGSGTVLVVADSNVFSDANLPRVYVNGEFIGESDPMPWTDTSTPDSIDGFPDLSTCESLEIILQIFADMFYSARETFGEPRSFASGGYLQYGIDLAQERGCDIEVHP
jgi:hypothetical protein